MAKQFQISTYVGNYECNIFGKKTNGKFIQILNIYFDSDESCIKERMNEWIIWLSFVMWKNTTWVSRFHVCSKIELPLGK